MNNKQLSFGGLVILLIASYFGINLNTEQPSSTPTVQTPATTASTGQTATPSNPTSSAQSKATQSSGQNDSIKIAQAFQQKQSNLQVQSAGTVLAVLPDDNEGSRHQKFLLKLDNGISILIAHNIDLAPRIENLKKGDTVAFYGEYEYSDKGGVVHWTHHDPNKRHIDGWLKHQGRTYQ